MLRNLFMVIRIGLLPFIALYLLGVWPGQKVIGDALDSARQAERGGQPGFAAIWLRKVTIREPFRKEIIEQIANDELAAGNTGQAEAAYMSARAQNVLSAEGFNRLATLLEKSEKWEQAAVIWSDLAGMASSADVYSHLVTAYRRAGQLDKALAAAQSWHLDFPQDGNASYSLAILESGHNIEKALQELEGCSAVPRCRDGLVSLRKASALASLSEDQGYRLVVVGRWLGGLGEWELAESAFQSAVGLSPGYAEAWAFLGQARLQNKESGLAELQKALALNPDSVLTRALLALYWGKDGDFKKALEQMQAAARLEPAQAVWQVELGNLTAEAGDLIAAQTFFHEAEVLEPDNPVVWKSITSFSLKYNVELRSMGLPAARRSVELRPNDPASLDSLGSILMALGDVRGAERILQQSIQIDPDYASGHYHLAQVLIQLSEQDQAVVHLQFAVKLDEGGPVGAMAGRLLGRILQPDGN